MAHKSKYAEKRDSGNMKYGPSQQSPIPPNFTPKQVMCEKHGGIFNQCRKCAEFEARKRGKKHVPSRLGQIEAQWLGLEKAP